MAPIVLTIIGGGSIVAYAAGKRNSSGQEETSPWLSPTAELDWVKNISSKAVEISGGHSGSLLRDNAVGRAVFDDDHLFDSLIASGQVREYRGFYDKSVREFYSVVSLGKRTSGYPSTTHGGLSAAIIDDSFGGLGGSLWKEGALGFRPPAFTARLEIDYKKKIPTGSIILISTSVESMEDRKLWMNATVSDGKKTVYANARALFIQPKLENVLFSWIPGWGRR